MHFAILVLVVAAAIYGAHALCNTCSAVTGLACVSNTQFAVCIDGLPTTSSISCPSGSSCTASAQVCSSGAAPSCGRCNTCDDSNVFACTGYNSFALCYGSNVPSSVSFACAGSLVCNVDSPQICVDPSVTGIGGTCPSVATTTTTVAPPTTTPNPATNPQAFCASVGTVGRYDVPSSSNCKQYVSCSLTNNVWVGNLYDCPGTTLFNATSQLCQTGVPARCA